jgi:serine protease
LFAAAGNENSSQASFPAAYNGVMSVAAVDINGVRAPYSNFGSTIDIAAPGGNSAVDLDHDGHPDGVLSTLMDDSTNPLTPIYAYYEGTSMASPHVAGVAALLLAINPALTPDQIDSLLTSTAVDLGAPGRDDFYGNGLVNAYAAVIAASNIGPQRRPQIFVSVPSLAFGTNKSDLSFGVINVGIGVLDVTAATVTMDQGDNWLHATTVAAGGSSNTNVSAVNVHIDRSNLADQVYTGSVHVASSNGGDADVGITMVVQHSSQPVDVNLFVLAVDATTLETKGQSVVNPTTGLGWGMFNLPQGNYILVCGSDDDENNTICDQGDTYCGLYPTLNSPQAVGLGSSPLGSLDFPVSAMSTSSADVQALLQKVRARGLRLMH